MPARWSIIDKLRSTMRRTYALFAKAVPGKRPRSGVVGGTSPARPKGDAKSEPPLPRPSEPSSPTLERKMLKPLVQRTDSPWVWASTDVDATELSTFNPSRVAAADRYFKVHGSRSRFIEPEEFNFEVREH